MSKQIQTRCLYDATPTGIFLPSGTTTDSNSFEKTNVFVIKQKGLDLLNICRSFDLDPSRSLSLSVLVEDVCYLSDALLTADDKRTSYLQVFSALQLSRIVEAIAGIDDDRSMRRVLSELLDGTLDLLSRSRSKAKDTLWELELLRALQLNGIKAVFDEPDLLLAGLPDQIGVACKKLYSDSNFSKILSNAVGQIERSLKPGIVAINMDDLLPENTILNAPNEEVAARMINEKIHDLMSKHERHLRRYMESNRAVAMLISCAALADLEQCEPQFCTFRQTVAWHIPLISKEFDSQFSSILSAFRASGSIARLK